jgi:hypothetical protein
MVSILHDKDDVTQKAIKSFNDFYKLDLTFEDGTTVLDKKGSDLQGDAKKTYDSWKDVGPTGNGVTLLPLLKDGSIKLWGTVSILKYVASKYQVAEGKPPASSNASTIAVKRGVAEAALDLYSSHFVKQTTKTEVVPSLSQKAELVKDFNSLLAQSEAAVEDQSKKKGVFGGDEMTIADFLFNQILESTAGDSGFKTDVNKYKTSVSTAAKSA